MNSASSSNDLTRSIETLVSDEEPLLTALSNCAALLFMSLPDINWAGFYLLDGDRLILGPFGGKPACTTIPMGKGVCGAAAARRETIRVEDVDQFPGHIACDDASRSEIVLPIVTSTGRLIGVLDIDAPILGRFTEEDQRELELFRDALVLKIEKILRRLGNPERLFA